MLVDPNWTRVAEVLLRHGVPVGAARLAEAEAHAKRGMDNAAEVGATDDRTRGWRYFDLSLTHAGVALSPATDAALRELHAYHQRCNLWESVPAEVPGVLAALRAQGLRLVVASNANGTLRVALDRLGLLPSFDLVIDSHELGVEKPDPALFRFGLERLGVDPAAAVHVGDFFHIDVVGARAAGMEGWLLDRAGLYADHDCPRFASLTAVAAAVATRREAPAP